MFMLCSCTMQSQFRMLVAMVIAADCIFKFSNSATVKNDTNLWVENVLLKIRQQQTTFSDVKPCRSYDVTIEITVSPYVKRECFDCISLYWETPTVLNGDQVALYDHDPAESLENPLTTFKVNKNIGYLQTPFSASNGHFNDSFYSFEITCFGYWIAYLWGDSGLLASSKCLTTQPKWMENIWSAIGRLSLANILIPGTHDSGAFWESYSPINDSYLDKVIYTQDLNISKQLIWGARALDLRISYYPNKDKIWYINHGIVPLMPLEDVLRDVRNFLENTNEIVILDLHRFPVGFSSNPYFVHSELIAYIGYKLKDHLVSNSFGWSSKLYELRHSSRRAILAYNSRYASGIYTWPPVQQYWGDAHNIKEFSIYFDGIYRDVPKPPWSAMVELTPNIWNIINPLFGGLREMAYQINPIVIQKFNREWGLPSHVVYCDYLRGTGIVQAAIKWNLKRSGYTNCILTNKSKMNK